MVMKRLVALSATLLLSACEGELAFAANLPVSGLPPRGTPASTDQVPVLPAGATNLQATTVGAIAALGGAGYTFGVGTYGALCDGTTDDHLAIQTAINAVEGANGGRIQFPAGVCYLGTVGITITGNLTRLQGQGGSALAGGLGTVFTYSGTGAAVTIGQAGAFNFNNGIDNIQILATGPAVMSSAAQGIVLNNSQYFSSHGIGVTNFEAGAGIVSQANGTSCSGAGGQCYTASNTFYDISLYQNFQGVLSTTLNGGIGENILGIHGGYVIGQAVLGSPVAGSIGLSLQASNAGVFENLDVETYAVCIENGATATAGGNRFMGTHTEFCTQHISNLSGSIHNVFIGHIPSSVASRAAVWSDAGNDNHFYGTDSGGTPTFLGYLSLSPSVDQSEAFTLSSAGGVGIIDTDTRAASRSFELVNGTSQYCYSDNFITQTCFLNSSTGSLNLKGSITGAAAVFTSPTNTDALDVINSTGTGVLDVTPNASAANSLVQVVNGGKLVGWSGPFTGQTFKLDAATGNFNIRTEAAQPGTDTAAVFEVDTAESVSVFDINTNATAANSTIALSNGASLNLYSDAGSTLKASINGSTGTASFAGPLYIAGKLEISPTAPAYSAGFSTGTPAIAGSTSAAFTVTLGATPGATGVLTMPAASAGWNCMGIDRTTSAGTVRETATTTTTVTFALSSTAASDVLQFQCLAL